MATLTPLRAIRAKCLDCMCGQYKEIRLCPVTKCPLYEYRDGHRPTSTGGTGAAEQDSKNNSEEGKKCL